jgi:hypothetical protein
MSTTSNLRWTNAGTKDSPDWMLVGPIDEIRAAAASGTAQVIKVQDVTVGSEYMQRGDQGAIRPAARERKASTKVDWSTAQVVKVDGNSASAQVKSTGKSTRMVRSK